MAFSFLVSEVVRPLRIDAQHAITLSFKVQRCAPADMTPAARRELALLKENTERLNDDVAAEIGRGGSTLDQRPIARIAIVAWGTLHQRLEIVTRLDNDTVSEADEARAILAAVFPDAVTFTRGDYETMWLRGEHTLDAIKQGGLTQDVARIAGDFVFNAVKAAHQRLGVVLGLAGSVRAPAVEGSAPQPDRRALLDAVTESIARYAHQITAIDADDAAAVAVATRALDPIMKYRAKARATRSVSSEDDGEDTPVTPVTPVNDQAQPVAPPHTPAANDGAAPRRNVA